MTKSTVKNIGSKPKTQAERFLEAAKKAQVDESGRAFSRAMGKITLAKNARKAAKIG